MVMKKGSRMLTKYRLHDALWKENPDVYEILKKSSSIEEARKALFHYLNELEWKYRSGLYDVHVLEIVNATEAIRVFKNLISPTNEELAEVSTLNYLWMLAKNEDEVRSELSDGFVLEFKHLFRAISGNANYYKGWLGPILESEGVEAVDFSQIKGRAAAAARSLYLRKMWEKISQYLSRYPSGLDPSVIEKRKKNVKRILDFFGATLDDWQDYTWQFQHIFRGLEGLKRLEDLISLTIDEKNSAKLAVESGIPWGITPYYLSLFDFEHPDRIEDYQVRSQVMPPMHYVNLMIEHRGERKYYFDFMGEHDTSPIDLVTRRYATVAIIKPYDACPQVCVYCQRNWEITGPLAPGAMAPQKKLDEAIDWFAEHPEIFDILITGGDPFTMGDEKIEYLLERFSSMGHIIHIRWGTRSPVTVPMRITDKLAELLGSYIKPGRRNVSVVTHVESAYEITPELAEAVMKLRRQGIYVYNQQVYVVENSRRFETVALRMAMKKVGIDPYYTFYPKGKEEHKDYLVPVARIAQERKEEARLLPGMFRTDEPVFNVPRLGKNHIRAWQDREIIAITPNGERVFLWHPWEKGITPAKPWVYKDVPIHGYLQEMEKRGENIEDYESIWYYY